MTVTSFLHLNRTKKILSHSSPQNDNINNKTHTLKTTGSKHTIDQNALNELDFLSCGIVEGKNNSEKKNCLHTVIAAGRAP